MRKDQVLRPNDFEKVDWRSQVCDANATLAVHQFGGLSGFPNRFLQWFVGIALGGADNGIAARDWEDKLERWLKPFLIGWVIRPGGGCVGFTLRD